MTPIYYYIFIVSINWNSISNYNGVQDGNEHIRISGI